ncbi:MAG TPA: hypothetical protein VGB73_06900 [Pyrinomonadaceae bacterium]|jgi:hypothetical protein
MKVFLSYAVGEMDAPIAARLRAVAAAYDIQILLPDRTQIETNLTADTRKKIKQSDAVIALRTKTARPASGNLVNLELQAASEAGKPIILLMEEGVAVTGAAENQIVRFNRLLPTAHEASLLNVLEQIRRHKQSKKELTALGWIAGIALGMLALTGLLSDEK